MSRIFASAAVAWLAASTAVTLAQSPNNTRTGDELLRTVLSANGKFILGAWLNWEEYPAVLDTPAKFNGRLGYNTGSFQVRQSIPPIRNPDGSNVTITLSNWDDNTDAIVFFTVYADQVINGQSGLDVITESDLTALAIQLNDLEKRSGRTIMLRYLPEMNGPWMYYGSQPEKFVANWKLMASKMRTLAPNVILVWSPNFDLNNRGDNGGSQPYWPGAADVDWVGTSQYWKSSQSAITTGGAFQGNYQVPPNYFKDSIQYVYDRYAVPNNKPFVLSEAAGAWEVPLSGSAPPNQVTQSQMQGEFWSQVFATINGGNYPLFKMAQIFEYTKPEDGYERDFRATWDPATLRAFLASLQPSINSNSVIWARNSSSIIKNVQDNTTVTTIPSSSITSNSLSETVTVATNSKSTSAARSVFISYLLLISPFISLFLF